MKQNQRRGLDETTAAIMIHSSRILRIKIIEDGECID
jgi:hypothetical protein